MQISRLIDRYGVYEMNKTKLEAKWIWDRAHNRRSYNVGIIAQRKFQAKDIKSAQISITADSEYRLYINGQWVADGPCRSWPNHFQYDVVDVMSYLKDGENDIQIFAFYFGVGDMHRIYMQPGLLAQLDMKTKSGDVRIVTDDSWKTAELKAWQPNTPKISCQMAPAELYDARLENQCLFTKAKVVCGAEEGPWKNLNPRDVALMTREPACLKRFIGANILENTTRVFCLPAGRLSHDDNLMCNLNMSAPCGMATEFVAKKNLKLKIEKFGFKVSVDGKQNTKNEFNLTAGKHIIVAFNERVACMHAVDKTIALNASGEFELLNPMDKKNTNPWVFIKLDGFDFHKTDIHFFAYPPQESDIEKAEKGYAESIDKLLKSVCSAESLKKELSGSIQNLSFDQMFVDDFVWQMQNKNILADAAQNVENPAFCINDNSAFTVVQPSRKGDVELAYDFGCQSLGYWHFDIDADEGTIIEFYAIENIYDGGDPQHTKLNRNAFRYIAKQGRNKFTSFKVRSGRYLYVTIRNQKNPVRIKHIGLLRTHYPVEHKAWFKCSDPKLEKIWEIAEYTVKMCMMDTYTDCPLYEQTLWVGDARNESLFGYILFGAKDIARRCIKLAAQSMESLPLVGCQVPSSWECILPAWSFLWGISVWDYYWFSGDKKFLKDIWPDVEKNLDLAYKHLDENGLFKGHYWNMFDWSHSDQFQEVVIHNSILFVGAINAAIKAAEVIGYKKQINKWQEIRANLCKDINKFWDNSKKSYPDSIHIDGKISPSICQHTSFLGLLYDVVPGKNQKWALKNTLTPPKHMITVGSPFAIFYLHECLEKFGYYDEIIESIYEAYVPMLEADATTVWETFAGSSQSEEYRGLTRSHCHAWSSAPVWFLSRIVLGIRQTAAGGKAYEISPWVKGLNYAKGQVAACDGIVQVEWKLCGKDLYVNYSAPKGVKVKFVKNKTHQGLNVKVSR